MSDKMTKKLETFLAADLPDDSRILCSKKEKRKSRKLKVLERAKRKRKLMNEILDEKIEQEPNNNEGKKPKTWNGRARNYGQFFFQQTIFDRNLDF